MQSISFYGTDNSFTIIESTVQSTSSSTSLHVSISSSVVLESPLSNNFDIYWALCLFYYNFMNESSVEIVYADPDQRASK